MVVRWSQYEIQLSCFMVLAVLSEIRECDSLNPEGIITVLLMILITTFIFIYSNCFILKGLALLEFRERIENDPYGAFSNWNSNQSGPCLWLGVQCFDGKVQVLDLSGFCLQGTLAPEIKKLRYLKSLYNPLVLKSLPSYRLLCGNDFDEDNPPAMGMFDRLLKSECNHQMKSVGTGAQDYFVVARLESIVELFWRKLLDIYLIIIAGFGKQSIHRRLAGESSNLAAVPPHSAKPQSDAPVRLRSGAFPALAKESSASMQSPAQSSKEFPKVEERPKRNGLTKILVIVGSNTALVIVLCLAFTFFQRYQGAKKVQAKDAALLHRLSKAFVAGVPRLNSAELQTACEDFSNIIETFSGCLMYKGILSSGVEIAVLSTSIRSSQQWSGHAEKEFKSKINHKNFVNVLGYCEEEDPFVRMMVFEYASNGNLYEHLHVKEMGHLDWTTRIKIIMGTSYCLEHMHHDLNPPVIHPNLQSDSILLTDDYSVKVVDVSFWADIVAKAKISDDEELEPLHSDPGPTREDNAMQYLSDKQEYSKLVDPSLMSYKNEELEVICEVIRECVDEDPRQRPTTKEITTTLREATKITPEAATSRFSPLWWAELEILSMESS
ncbi:hypothetical protein Cgig2_020564 [Carnegiea gigantea]|uniref:Protein kinase domain-containing protein n=1 Tax=Carnegiea gigantea TaxID=171969 RepID=A0A9Q1GLU8_9CARY|nr:hypothetical protein Cgig2_020564 [Carnegiea gigantea]